MTTTAPTDRKSICRLLVARRAGNLERCTGEVADPGGEIELCVQHLADAMQLLQRRMPRRR